MQLSSAGSQLALGATHQAGDIIMTGAAAARAGWLLCDGSAVSRSTFAALFTAIGTAFGVGDGSTTFNLPDLRQRFPLGKAAAGTGNVLGGAGGAIDHLHSVDPPNTTSTNQSAQTVALSTTAGSVAAAAIPHTHDVNIAAFNSGTNNPPFQVVNFIIKT